MACLYLIHLWLWLSFEVLRGVGIACTIAPTLVKLTTAVVCV